MEWRNDLKDSIQNLLFNLKCDEQEYKDNLRSTKDLIEHEVQGLVYALQSRMKWLLSCADSVYKQNVDSISRRISSAEVMLRESDKQESDMSDYMEDLASPSKLNLMSFVRNKNALSDLISSYGHIVVDFNSTSDGTGLCTNDRTLSSSDTKNSLHDEKLFSNNGASTSGIMNHVENVDLPSNTNESLRNTASVRSDMNSDSSSPSTLDMSSLTLIDPIKNDDNFWLSQSSVTTENEHSMDSNIIPVNLLDIDNSKWVLKENSSSEIPEKDSIEDDTTVSNSEGTIIKGSLEDLTLSELVKHSINSTKIFTSNDYLIDECKDEGSSNSSPDIEYLNKILDAPKYKFLLAQTILQKYGGNLKRKFHGDVSERASLGKKKMEKNDKE